jgi:hypothetical protein
MRRLLLLFGALSLLTFSGMAPAYATTSTGSFGWDAGGGVLCTLGIPNACPDIAMASNGDTVTVSASGALNAATGAASGGGTFIHKDSAGNMKASGTFTVSRLIDFSFYGCDGNGFPSTLCGGRAALAVQLHPAPSVTLNGILWVTCLIGSPPSGVMEGIRLNVNDVITFNKSIGGDTVFIATS